MRIVLIGKQDLGTSKHQLQIPRIGGAPYYRDAMVAEHEEQEEGGTNLPSSPWLKPPFDRPFSSQVIRDSTSHKPTQLLHFFFFFFETDDDGRRRRNDLLQTNERGVRTVDWTDGSDGCHVDPTAMISRSLNKLGETHQKEEENKMSAPELNLASLGVS